MTFLVFLCQYDDTPKNPLQEHKNKTQMASIGVNFSGRPLSGYSIRNMLRMLSALEIRTKKLEYKICKKTNFFVLVE